MRFSYTMDKEHPFHSSVSRIFSVSVKFSDLLLDSPFKDHKNDNPHPIHSFHMDNRLLFV